MFNQPLPPIQWVYQSDSLPPFGTHVCRQVEEETKNQVGYDEAEIERKVVLNRELTEPYIK
jgi:hypothetical protein